MNLTKLNPVKEEVFFDFKDAFLMLLLGAALGIGLNMVFSTL